MVKRICTINKKIMIIIVFVCVLIFLGLFLAFSHRERGAGSDKALLTNMIYKNYENLRGKKDTPIESISENGLTLKIYDIFWENHEIVLKYDLMEDNTIISKQSIYSFVLSDNNQNIDYKTEYQAENLTVLKDENAETVPDYKDKTVKIVISIFYNRDKSGQALSQDFEFNYTPDKVYDETVTEVNREFSYLNKQIKINRITSNGLYILLECDYDFKTLSDIWYTFKVQDESGKNVACYIASAENGSVKYFLDWTNEKVLYLYPSAHKYDTNNKEKENITPIDEKIEIKLP